MVMSRSIIFLKDILSKIYKVYGQDIYIMACALVQNCLRGLENCHPVSLCNRDEIAQAMQCGGDNCLVVDGTKLQPCERDDCLNVTLPDTTSHCEVMTGGIFMGETLPLMPSNKCEYATDLQVTEGFPSFDGFPDCETDLYTSGDLVCFCPCEDVPCPDPPMCTMEALLCEGVFTPTDERGCVVGCPTCPQSPPPPCPVFRCAEPPCEEFIPAPIGEDGCPTGCPTCPPPPPPSGGYGYGDRNCMNGDEVVPVGWSGPGAGDNWCNTCGCEEDGVLSCTRMACTPPCVTFVCEDLDCKPTIPAPVDSDGCPTGCARCPDPPAGPPPSVYGAPRPHHVARLPPSPPPREDTKSPSPPPPREDTKSPSPPPPRVKPVPVRAVEYVGKKWSKDPVKNRDILSKPVEFADILKKMAPTQDAYKVQVKYSKYSEYTIKEETDRCNARPLVESCVVVGPVNVSRRLLTTLVLYTYDLVFGGENATEVAYAVHTETDGAEEVTDVNMTVVSEEEFNITSDDIFVSSVEVYTVDPPPTPPPPNADDEFITDVYTTLIIMAGLCFLVAMVWRIYKCAAKPRKNDEKEEQFLVPEVQDKVLYSQNPIHSNGSA